MLIVCPQCGRSCERPGGWVNRSAALGLRVYCSRRCSGLGRRSGKTQEQKRAEKSAYDRARLARMGEQIRKRKRAYYASAPVQEREKARRADPQWRARKSAYHLAYCRSPEYRRWKADYDRRARTKEHGEYADAVRVLWQLEREIASRMTRYEIYSANGLVNKKQQRSRA